MTRIIKLTAIVACLLLANNTRAEDQYLVGDWDNDGRDNIAVRRGFCVVKDYDFDGVQNAEQCFGAGNYGRQYLVGDWDNDGDDNLAFRPLDIVYMDYNDDSRFDGRQRFGRGHAEDEYFSGDWDGDGRDDLAVRSGQCIQLEYTHDSLPDRRVCLGGFQDEYLVGNWDGESGDSFAVRYGRCVYMDRDGDGTLEADSPQCFGEGAVDQYLVGDWDGDGIDNLATRRGNRILMDTNGDEFPDIEQHFGDGVTVFPPQRVLPSPPCPWLYHRVDGPFLVLDSEAIRDAVLRKRGNNNSQPTTTIGINGPEYDAWRLEIADDPTITIDQTRITLVNRSAHPNGFKAGNCWDNSPVIMDVAPGGIVSVVLGLSSTSTLVLEGNACTPFCMRRSEAAFSEFSFGSLAAGRQLTITWLRD